MTASVGCAGHLLGYGLSGGKRFARVGLRVGTGVVQEVVIELTPEQYEALSQGEMKRLQDATVKLEISW